MPKNDSHPDHNYRHRWQRDSPPQMRMICRLQSANTPHSRIMQGCIELRQLHPGGIALQCLAHCGCVIVL
jgi:hypothetical protein